MLVFDVVFDDSLVMFNTQRSDINFLSLPSSLPLSFPPSSVVVKSIHFGARLARGCILTLSV